MIKSDSYINQFLAVPLASAFDDGFKNKYFSEDPLFLSFSVFFDQSSPLLNSASNYQKESAERYFLNLDDDVRAGYVVDLRQRLNKLISEHQYYFQSISGLNTFYSREQEDGSDISFTIETLESLDMRITKIKELYNRITFDYYNKKEILPDNLRWLDMKITVADGRKLAKWINGNFVDITPSLDTLCFTVRKTQMSNTEGHSYLEELSNKEYEMASNSLTFSGGRGKVEDSRIALGELLKNEKTTINSINQNVRDGKEAEILSSKNFPNAVIEKKSLTDQIKDLGKSKLGQLQSGARTMANEEMNKLIGRAELATGLRNTNNTIVSDQNFFEVLRGAVSSGSLRFTTNPDLERKILDEEKLTKEDKSDLYKELLFKVDKL
jgi:hypothetical protein